MKIAIIGAGAMGSLFGGRLALAGQEVWLLDIWREHIDSINENGLTILSDGQEIVAHPKATDKAASIGKADLLLIFVKSGNTAAAAKTAGELCGPATAILTLQNGYGNAEELAELLGPDKIVAGTTAQGATLLGPGKVLHGGNGETHIGEFSGQKTPRLETIAGVLSAAGFSTTVETDVTTLVWGKLIVNVGINALTAITGVRNGVLAEHPETRRIMELAVSEAVNVATAAGIALPFDNPVEKVLSVALATGSNRSSMLQDLDNGRITEIDAINGAIVRQGTKLGVPTPVNEVLSLLVKAMQQMKQQK